MGTGSCYGHIEIPSTSKNCIYKWYIKVNKCLHNHVVVGISSKPSPNKPIWDAETGFTDKYGYRYMYWAAWGAARDTTSTWNKQYGDKAKEGDVIGVILQFNDGLDGTISYEINGKNQGVAHNVYAAKDIKYKFAMSICATGVEEINVTMEKFTIEGK